MPEGPQRPPMPHEVDMIEVLAKAAKDPIDPDLIKKMDALLASDKPGEVTALSMQTLALWQIARTLKGISYQMQLLLCVLEHRECSTPTEPPPFEGGSKTTVT